MEKAYSRGELACKILLLISVGMLIPAAIMAPNSLKTFLPLINKLRRHLERDSTHIRRSLSAMKKDRLVKTEMRNGETVFVITEEGKKKIVRGKFEKIQIKEPKRWDGKWRIVLFDIPEEHKDAREALRLKLRKLGFYRLQKSCFVHPYECKDELDFVTEYFGVSQFTNYVIAESVESGKELRDYFSL